MLRDWDLQSTLLRRALQAGARHVPAEGAVAILDSSADLAALERRIVEQADGSHRSWVDWALAPVERVVTAMLMSGGISPRADRPRRRFADRARRRLILRRLVLGRPHQIARRDPARRHRRPAGAAADAGQRAAELVVLSAPALRRRRARHPRPPPRRCPGLGDDPDRGDDARFPVRARGRDREDDVRAASCCSPSARA